MAEDSHHVIVDTLGFGGINQQSRIPPGETVLAWILLLSSPALTKLADTI